MKDRKLILIYSLEQYKKKQNQNMHYQSANYHFNLKFQQNKLRVVTHYKKVVSR